MKRLEKAQKQLKGINIQSRITSGTLYVCINDSELELADFEIDFRAKEYDTSN